MLDRNSRRDALIIYYPYTIHTLSVLYLYTSSLLVLSYLVCFQALDYDNLGFLIQVLFDILESVFKSLQVNNLRFDFPKENFLSNTAVLFLMKIQVNF